MVAPVREEQSVYPELDGLGMYLLEVGLAVEGVLDL
jgi:hypothetical protein